VVLTAPPVGGGALQITRLLHTGTPVKKGDIVFEFDPAEQRYKLEQSRSELQQAEQEIGKAMADADVLAAQDKVELLKARFALRRAELEVQRNELVSVIDAKKNELALQHAKDSVAKLQQDLESHVASGRATVRLARRSRTRRSWPWIRRRRTSEKMLVAAPMDGLVSIEKNAGMDEMGQGMSMSDYRAGDQVRPEAPLRR